MVKSFIQKEKNYAKNLRASITLTFHYICFLYEPRYYERE